MTDRHLVFNGLLFLLGSLVEKLKALTAVGRRHRQLEIARQNLLAVGLRGSEKMKKNGL
jgi:hypothetical protein